MHTLNPAAADLRADLKMPFHTLHLSSQYQIHIYRFISQISQHENNLGTFYWLQTLKWVTPNGFTSICRIWWRNRKKKKNNRGMNAAKQQNSASEEAVRFSVHCSSNSRMIFLKLLTQSKRWHLSYMDGYFSWWTFSLLKSWQMQVLSQENLVWATILYWPQWRKHPQCYLPELGI